MVTPVNNRQPNRVAYRGKFRDSAHKPGPAWRFELHNDDFENCQTLTLKPAVVQRIAAAIARQSDATRPGFAFIPNLHHFTSSVDAAFNFQTNLVQQVYRHMEVAYGLDTVEYYPGDVLIVDRDMKGRIGNRGGKGIGSLHWDGGIDQLVSFLYLSQNIRGGRPMVGDVIRYLEDKKDFATLDTLRQSDPRYVIRAEQLIPQMREKPKSAHLLAKVGRQFIQLIPQKAHLLEKYRTVVDDPAFDQHPSFPMVLINNRRLDGISHTGTEVQLLKEGQPGARLLRQVFIRTDLIPNQKIILVGPPPNSFEKTLLPEHLRHKFDHCANSSDEHHDMEM